MKRSGAAFAAAAACCAVLLGATGIAFAGHPFVTEAPGTQGKGNVEVEFSYEYQKADDGTKTSSLGNGFTLGIAPKLDLAIGYGYDFVKAPDGAKDRAMGDVEVQLKTFFNEGKDAVPTFGLKGGASLPVEEGGQTTILLTGIAEWAFEPFTVFANVGADIGTHLAGNDERTDLLRASVAGSREVREALALVSEVIWEKQTKPSEDATVEWMVGAQWGINDAMTLDAGVRFGLTDDSPTTRSWPGSPGSSRGKKPPRRPPAPGEQVARRSVPAPEPGDGRGGDGTFRAGDASAAPRPPSEAVVLVPVRGLARGMGMIVGVGNRAPALPDATPFHDMENVGDTRQEIHLVEAMTRVSPRPRRISVSRFLVAWSRPAEGSSRMRASGPIARMPARATSFFSPWESLWLTRSPKSAMPRDASDRFATSRASAGVLPRFKGPNATSSRTVGQKS